MERRKFAKNIMLGGLAANLSLYPIITSCSRHNNHSDDFKNMVKKLLSEWCEAMLKSQIINPLRPEIHGSLNCPACKHIHGRCMDAVYPFLYMRDKTGNNKYLEGAKLLMEWAGRNVSQEDGSWTVIPNPKSWKGITVFGAISLSEALLHHGHVLDNSLYKKWEERLSKAANFIYNNFDLTFTNINYGATAIYALYLLGIVLDNRSYTKRSHELANGIDQFFTKTDYFLLGEGKPSQKISDKGLYAIDLGYNVEESLSNLVLYASETHNEKLMKLLEKSLNTHLEFMLPDGAWDNSWGTRQFKWTYWGSRTCDGSQLSYAFLSDLSPAYSTAVLKNTQLLKRCTSHGFLHGGPHYVQHGVKPCIHHTFEHAKPLASLLDNWDKLKNITKETPLPREKEYGIKHFSDIDTVLIANGPWRGTVTAYDALYKSGEYRQATGGALSLLYHNNTGLLFTASMAKYKLAEKNNQQPNPGKDFALTPRIETFTKEDWFTNLFDLTAELNSGQKGEKAYCSARVHLKNEKSETVIGTASCFILTYEAHPDKFIISAKPLQNITEPTALILPIVSKNNEEVQNITSNIIQIEKSEENVIIKANVPLNLIIPNNERIFNMVPGVESVPVKAYFTENSKEEIIISIYTQNR